MASMFKRATAIQIVLSLFASLLISITSIATANAVACDDGSSAQNNIFVTPSQGKAFYIDSGQGQNIDASYVGYRVRSAVARQGVWVKLDNFTGGVVTLANQLDSEYALNAFAGGDTNTAYFLLKATGASSAAQSHRITVYNGRPEAGNVLYQCNYTFTRVQETIKANPNKVDKVTVGTVPSLGGTLDVQVFGSTGTIGAGKIPDYDAMWVTPAAQSSFPSRAMRLEKVEILYDDGNINTSSAPSCGSGKTCYSDQLLVPNLRNVAIALGGSNQKTLNYWLRYTFRVMGATPSFTFKPISQISSGTQMKHTPMNSFDTGQASQPINLSSVSYAGITVSKVVNTTTSATLTATGSGSSAKLVVPYRVTISNSGSAAVALDQVIDKPDTAVDIYGSFTPTAKYFNVSSGGSATSTVNLAVPTKNASGELIFSGPFAVPSNGRVEIDYQVLVPQCPTGSGTNTYLNSAYAKIGSTTVGSATAGFVRQASVQTSCSSATSVTSIPSPTDVRIVPEAVTNPATSVTTTTATINGAADSNGISGLAISFEWGTTASLGSTATASTSTSTTSTNPINVSANLTGLTQGTLYYYRIKIGDVVGEILTFVTTQPVAEPTVSTDAPSGVSGSDATLNATIDPNSTEVYVDLLVWQTNDTITVEITDDVTLSPTASGNARSIFAGAFASQVSVKMTDFELNASNFIAPNATIYYRAVYEKVTGGTRTLAAQTRQFTMTTYSPQLITFNAISDITYGASAPTINPTADSGMAITHGSDTPLVCTVNATTGVITILKAGTCTITADQGGGLKSGTSTYYDPAEQVVQSFEVLPVAITLTADAKTKQFGATDPTLTAQVTSGALVGSDTLTGTLTRAAGESVGTYLISRGTYGPGSNYTVTYVSANLTITAKQITVNAVTKTKVFGASDPALTYTHTPSLNGSDTFTGTLTRSAGSDVGGYSILIGSLALPAGYQLNYVGETLTITAKPSTITADSKSKNAGDSTPTFTFQNGALVSPNTISGVTYNFSSGSYSSNTTPPTPDGSYTITPSAAVFSNGNASNYNITYVTGTYTITSLQNQTLTWTTIGNKTYGSSATGTVVSNRGLTPVTVISMTTSICTVPNSSASGATVTLLSVGVCELKASQAGNGTYGPASDTIETFTVLAAPLVITASSPTGIREGDAVPTITASYSGFVNSENSSVLTAQPVCVTSYTTSSTAGTNETTSCSGASATNYSISYVAGAFTVAAAQNNSQNSNPSPVVKQKPTIRWSNPSPINVGTPLSGTQLNAIFSVPGTCVYTPALGTLLPEGTHTLSVTCTPTDLTNYEPVTTTVTILVKAAKKKATIYWFNPSPINNPTPLSGTQLNAIGSVPGEMTYSPNSGTVLAPGSHVLTVRLKPTDTEIDELETKVTILVRSKPANPNTPNKPSDPKDPNDPKSPTPNDPKDPPIGDPEAPKKPVQGPDPVAIATPKNAVVLQTAGKSDEVVAVKLNQEQTGYIVAAADWSISISSTTKFVQGNTADSTSRVVIEKGNTVTTSGVGFKPFSQVDVYVYSTPIWLGAVITDQFGNFTTTLPMPVALPEGEHTFQAQGFTPDEVQRTAAVPITLIPATVIAKPGQLRFDVYFAMNSTVITNAERTKIARQVKSALAKAATNAKLTVNVVGWVQPNPNPGNISFLSTNRAKNVAELMKKLGLKGSYTLSFPGLEKNNIPTARRSSVVIKWNLSK